MCVCLQYGRGNGVVYKQACVVSAFPLYDCDALPTAQNTRTSLPCGCVVAFFNHKPMTRLLKVTTDFCLYIVASWYRMTMFTGNRLGRLYLHSIANSCKFEIP
jgi:hypothetical protein